ncbi:MAG: hypothetical protein M1837_000107 [Sclerophora amabilis]|nr:MAG: hypothetical protein M1837_000107 [Sclerophora amabilis]
MADGLNGQRALRVAQVMSDFRNLQTHIAQVRAEPVDPDEFYEDGYALLRQCAVEAQALLAASFNESMLQAGPDGNEEQKKMQLQRILLDASTRRFQAQKIYLCTAAANRWISSRAAILQGQKPHAGHVPALQSVDSELRSMRATITDERVWTELRTEDYHAGRWINDDPSLASVQQWLRSQLCD